MMFGFMHYAGIPMDGMWIYLPAVAFITWINLKSVRFCKQCSSFNPIQPFGKADFCRKCGAALEKPLYKHGSAGYVRVLNYRGVAQLASALRSGRRGRGFKSRHPETL